jgi:leader peptidase (prepilin peptidase) / N-methyltransferase
MVEYDHDGGARWLQRIDRAPPASAQGPHFFLKLSLLRRPSEWLVPGLACILSVAITLVLVPDMHGLFGGGLACLMIAIALVDARHFIIPDELTVAALALGFVNAAVDARNSMVDNVAFATLRGVGLALVFLALRTVYRWCRGRQGLGLGDVKLAGVAGIWLDWLTIPVVIEIAALAALAFHIVREIARQRTSATPSIPLTGRLPFGLFLAPAIWLGWLVEAVLRNSPMSLF